MDYQPIGSVILLFVSNQLTKLTECEFYNIHALVDPI